MAPFFPDTVYISYLADCCFTVGAVERQRLPVVAAALQAAVLTIGYTGNRNLWRHCRTCDVTECDNVMSGGGGRAAVSWDAWGTDENIAVTTARQSAHLLTYTLEMSRNDFINFIPSHSQWFIPFTLAPILILLVVLLSQWFSQDSSTQDQDQDFEVKDQDRDRFLAEPGMI